MVIRSAPDDYSSTTQTTGTAAVGGSATGDIATGGDRDWFPVTLEASGTCRIDLEGWQNRAGTLRDPYPRGVYDDHGVLIADTTPDYGGWGPICRVTFTAQDTGTYCTYYVATGALRKRGRHLHAVGGRGHVTCAAGTAAAFAGPRRAAFAGAPVGDPAVRGQRRAQASLVPALARPLHSRSPPHRRQVSLRH